MKWVLSAKDVEWANKLLKKYPGVYYTNSTSQAHAVLSLPLPQIPPTEHERLQKLQRLPAHRIPQRIDHHQQPRSALSVDYGTFTLLVERLQPDGNLRTLQTFQQRGLYNEIYALGRERSSPSARRH